jgi:ParB-like chromosome segregation protein Spo0J
VLDAIRQWCNQLRTLDADAQIAALNEARQLMHEAGPFANEPVDYIRWVPNNSIEANDYNPNSVAPPEMELLRLSIQSDGYTQPIVSWMNGASYEVVDGFHRNRVGRECDDVRERVRGYLPLTIIKSDREDRSDRIASTIRHNRARGKHAVTAMSDIVIELKRRNWSDKKIGTQLGMDADEVLRLSQISGLAEMFQDREFSEAWDAADPLAINEEDALDDQVG